MTTPWAEQFWVFAGGCALLFAIGLYCIAVSRNLIRILIGMELLTKSVTLLLILAGRISGRVGLGQSLVITLIVVEVVAISVGAGIVIGAYRKNGAVDARTLMNLKG
jgi:NADH:ubiquinone oxidoreductase subunit K